MVAWRSNVDRSNAVYPPKRRIEFSWSDPTLRGIFWQVVVVGALGSGLYWLISTAFHNMEVRGITTGFAFLGREAGFPIAEHMIDYLPSDTYLRALMVGVLNTLRVAIIGIVLATILGTLIGIARLSSNWLLAKISAVYVELVRDLPLLLQLLFWYAILQALPGPRQAASFGGISLYNRGLSLPALEWQSAHSWALLVFIVGLVVTHFYQRRTLALRLSDGKPRKIWPVALGLMVLAPIATWFALGAPLTISYPALVGFNFRGGMTISPEFFALLIGLVTYTAGFIAEIVRSGILAVNCGQREAAQALGLRQSAILRLIILPQALRVIIPPMTSQFLNLTKNSSLAIAIGYQDIVSVMNTTLNQTGQAIEAVVLIMAVYLTISLSISLLMNWYNARIALSER